MKYILFTIAFLMTYHLSSQMYNGGCVITVQDDAVLHVQGEYIHDSGTLNNLGIINIGTGFENNSSMPVFTTPAGTLNFFGGMPAISGNEVNFFNLSVSGNQLVLEDQNLSIDGVLDLGEAILRLNDNRLLLHDSSTGAIVASSGGVLANSPTTVIWGVDGGTGPYAIPFHNGTEQLNAQFSIGSNNGSDGSNISVTTYATAADNSPLPPTVTDLNIAGSTDGLNVADRYWHVVPNNFASLPDGTVSFTYSTSDNADNNLDDSNLSIYKWEDSPPWMQLMSNTQANTVMSQETSGLEGFYTLASNTVQGDNQIGALLHYNLDECSAYLNIASQEDYSEFTPNIVTDLMCGSVTGTVIQRRSPEVNSHSCTPGLNDTRALCVSSELSCNFVEDSDLAFRFDITVAPDAGETLSLGGIRFYQQAPESFDWIDGADGINNYPTQYGLRVLRDGMEVFRSVDNSTSLSWQLDEYLFNDPVFEVATTSIFTFELLGYCQIGNPSAVTAWDLEDVVILGNCVQEEEMMTISGIITDLGGEAQAAVSVGLSDFSDELLRTTSDEEGRFEFAMESSTEILKLNFQYDDPNYLEDITILDLIGVHRHVLGLLPLGEYQAAAADINDDNLLTALDLVEFRRIILGRSAIPSADKQWIFIDKTSEEVDLNTDIEDANLALDGEAITREFVSFKRGDIYNSNFDELASSRSLNSVVLSTFNNSLNKDKAYTLDFQLINQAEDLEGIQGMMIFDESIEEIEFTSDSYDIDYAQIEDDQFGFLATKKSNITESVSHIFSIRLVAGSDLEISKALSLSTNGIMRNEAILTEQTAALPIALQFLDKEVLSENKDDFDLRVSPNPVNQIATIQYELTDDTLPTSIVISDLLGRQLVSMKTKSLIGLNTVYIKDELRMLNEGVYILQLVHGDFLTSKRIVVVR